MSSSTSEEDEIRTLERTTWFSTVTFIVTFVTTVTLMTLEE